MKKIIIITLFAILPHWALAKEFNLLIGGEYGKGVVVFDPGKEQGESYSSLFLGGEYLRGKSIIRAGFKQINHKYSSEFTGIEYTKGQFDVSRVSFFSSAAYALSSRLSLGGEVNFLLDGGIFVAPEQEQSVFIGPVFNVKIIEKTNYYIESGLSYQTGAGFSSPNIHIVALRLNLGVDMALIKKNVLKIFKNK